MAICIIIGIKVNRRVFLFLFSRTFKIVNIYSGKLKWLVNIIILKKLALVIASGAVLNKNKENAHNEITKPKRNKNFKAKVLGRLIRT